MQVIRPVGREAAAKKYDILSALMAHGLAGDKHRQRLVLRLMALITARYNWQRNELAVGQREIARLWSVDERTVKREMARLRNLCWLEVKRAGARGRVSVYGLGLERIMLDTRPEWDNIGPDFVERFGGSGPAAPLSQPENIVPFPRPAIALPDGVWGGMRARLAAEDPVTDRTWFAGLAELSLVDGCLTLAAPSRFHASYVQAHLIERLLVAARRVDPSIAKVRLEAP